MKFQDEAGKHDGISSVDAILNVCRCQLMPPIFKRKGKYNIWRLSTSAGDIEMELAFKKIFWTSNTNPISVSTTCQGGQEKIF